MAGMTATRPVFPQTSSSTSAHSASSSHSHSHGHLFGRLQSLFPTSSGNPDGLLSQETLSPSSPIGQFSGIHRAKTEPAQLGRTESAPEPDREAVKVLIVTWNMGDALPKGDLTVLLGQIPSYQPPTPSPGLPQLPIENKHPYHIVVVAGQECPTPSGVPRGLGGGLLKGVVAKKEDKEKERKGQIDDLGTSERGSGAPIVVVEKTEHASSDSESDSEENPFPESGSSRPETPTTHHHPHSPIHRHHGTKTKGWSTILDEWLCGLTTRIDSYQPPSPVPGTPLEPSSGANSPLNYLSPPKAPVMIRSSSAPVIVPEITTSPTSITTPLQDLSKPLPIPITTNAPWPHNLSVARSPLSRSHSSDEFLSSPEKENGFLLPSVSDQDPQKLRTPIKIRNDRSENVSHDEAMTGTGPYLHVVKERLLGMYLTIYVYKGCERLVQGVDKDVVTAGLAGGRLGNKGGIGISLKLADHRFLFVNSHLAAHTGRNSTRLANIAKIKNELKLDCFLPRDDPRSQEPDLTDRFDTVFWCGDLNFRLDITRLHADWLIDKKNYEEALKFDQLRLAMADAKANPFPGFEEGGIDFPPTFKYDVWKSIKATNRDVRRSLRRRKTLEGKGRPDLSRSLPVQNVLSHVPEAGSDENIHLSASSDSRPPQTEDEEDVQTDTATLNDRRSLDSGYTSAAQTYNDTVTDVDDDLAEAEYHASQAARQHRGSLVEKGKHFLSKLKMDGMLSPGSARRGSRQKESIPYRGNPGEYSGDHRRASITSNRSMMSDADSRKMEFSTSASSAYSSHPIAFQSPFQPATLGQPSVQRRTSISSKASSPPRQPLTRRFSVLKRTVSGKSVKGHTENGMLEHDGVIIGAGQDEDNRLGVYDTSKKQRVPSWCDRVLWKAHVTPDVQPQVETPSPIDHRENAFFRISHALSNLGHLRSSNALKRSSTIEPSPPEQHSRLPQSISPPPLSPTQAPPISPPESPKLPIPSGLIPSPRPPNRPKRGGSLSKHILTDSDSVSPGKPARPIITFDLGAVDMDLNRSSDFPHRARPRANSEVVNGGERPQIKSSPSFPPRISAVIDDTSAAEYQPEPDTQPREPRRNSASLLPRFQKRKNTLENLPSSSTIQKSSSHPTPLPQGTSHPTVPNSFSRFLKDLPNLLHVRSSIFASGENDDHPANGSGSITPKRRHLKGEVVCLHYGTIDDAGMRQLEGRSDHRPAIFAGAVYV